MTIVAHVCPLLSDRYWLSFVAITWHVLMWITAKEVENVLHNEELNTTRTRRFICGQVIKDDCYVKNTANKDTMK